MHALLAHYYIKNLSNQNTDLIILCLLHELRIMTAQQITILINTEYSITNQNVHQNLIHLKKVGLIERIKSDIDNKTYCYYLTKNGHNNIGGMYSFPRVPEYNLNHHLMVTNALIDTLNIVKDNPHLKVIQTERRQAFEYKDFNKERKGKVFTVSDFLFQFKGERGRNINWFFEIELTAKTKRRYLNGIFPKYLKALDKNKDAHLFYVTPSVFIFEELKLFKTHFLRKNEFSDDELFERLHIIAQTNFKTEFQQLVYEDKFINW